jgi:hypothetical protein
MAKIILSEDNFIASAQRFKYATPTYAYIIWIVFIIAALFIGIYGDGINDKYFPIICYIFLSLLFASFFIYACKNKVIPWPFPFSKDAHPESFSLFKGGLAILSILGLVLTLFEMMKLNIF